MLRGVLGGVLGGAVGGVLGGAVRLSVAKARLAVLTPIRARPFTAKCPHDGQVSIHIYIYMTICICARRFIGERDSILSSSLCRPSSMSPWPMARRALFHSCTGDD